MEYTIIKSFDNENLYIKVYMVEKPKAAVQIVHGMMEHQERYESIAKFLNKNGYAVITSDLRGHGNNAKELGFFKENLGYEALILDQVEITKYIKQNLEIPNVIIYGHSMGSIITRALIREHSNDYHKVILSGFPNYNTATPIAITLSNIIKLFKGKHGHSKILHKGALGPFEKSIKNRKTNLDWLSINNDNIDNYINDPLCGFEFSNQAYNDLFHLLYLIGRKNSLNPNQTLPILLLNGAEDPCVGELQGIQKSLDLLKSQGFNRLTHISYPSFRHEILNEKDNENVYRDFINFIEEKIC